MPGWLCSGRLLPAGRQKTSSDTALVLATPVYEMSADLARLLNMPQPGSYAMFRLKNIKASKGRTIQGKVERPVWEESPPTLPAAPTLQIYDLLQELWLSILPDRNKTHLAWL